MGANILVVDDDPNVVEILTESLRGKGYNTESAYDGDEAIEKYDLFKPDLVVLDIVLPEKSGFEVCDEIRARDIHRDVPIIIISANSIPDSMIKGFRAGAQDYIKKPFSLKEIVAKVDNFISQAHKRKNLREQNIQLEGEVQKGQEDFTRVNKTLKRKTFDMRTLFGLSRDLNKLMDQEDLINIFALTLIGQLGIESVALFYAYDEGESHMSYAGGKGIQGNVLKSIRLSREMGLSIHLLKSQDVVNLNERSFDENARKEAEFLLNFGFVYCIPLIVKSRLSGIVFISKKLNNQGYRKDDLDLFKAICSSAATGFENSRLYSELQNTYLSTIKVLVSTIEAKDSYTSGHTERVADYAKMLAYEMGLSKKDREIVAFGAVLHDIGKLGVYENILNKPGALTEKEWEIVKSHPEVGANIIKNMKFLEAACDLVRHHHERLDGKGYPDGLAGSEISQGTRIVAVADSFDAMTSDRPYRKAYTIEEALEQLRLQDDKFDREVVSYLELIVKKGKIEKSKNR